LKVLFIFLDGVGIGKKDSKNNPFFFTDLPKLKEIFNDQLPSKSSKIITNKILLFIPTDAKLGVKGLPQSGTGQTSIFCGVNAPKLINKHFGPYPYSSLRPIINERNIFKILKEKGKKVSFVNAYPRQFFEYIESGKTRFTVTTLSCLMSGIPLKTYYDLQNKNALSADITGEGWKRFGYNFEPITPFEAGKRLYNIALKNDFTVYEFFYTDHAGHSKDKEFAKNTLLKLDGLLEGLLKNYNKEKLFIIIISDHGNLEDISTKTHTLNKVPTILIGKTKNKYIDKIKNISDIYYIILDILNAK